MLKGKFLSISILMVLICILFSSSGFGVVNAENIGRSATTVYLTGDGIATRLHKPVLEEFPNVNIEFTRILEELPETKDPDVPSDSWLFLGTPVYKHKQHILCSAKKYKNILCEKPVGLSTDEINEIKDVINQNQVLFRVNYSLRFLPRVEEIKQFMKSNDIKSVTITCSANFNQNPPNKAWKDDYKLGGGILYSILPHMVDLLDFLDCEQYLNDITFQSTTEVPMNDIKLYSKTLNGTNTAIDINLCEDFDELTLKIETSNGSQTFDLIDSSENKISDTRYCNGTLSATSEISPWRISFRHLLKTLFINPEDYRFARIEDAESVHKVLDVIMLQQETR